MKELFYFTRLQVHFNELNQADDDNAVKWEGASKTEQTLSSEGERHNLSCSDPPRQLYSSPMNNPSLPELVSLQVDAQRHRPSADMSTIIVFSYHTPITIEI
jgi:hypothetical protein